MRTWSLSELRIPMQSRASEATALLMPERESSKIMQSSGLAPSLDMAVKYGSGNGLARVHSAPMIRKSIRRRRSRAARRASAVDRGQLVTHAERMPWLSAQSRNLTSPGIGTRSLFSGAKIILRKSRSFSAMIFVRSCCDRALGSSDKNISSSTFPCMLCSKNFLSTLCPYGRRISSNTRTYTGSVAIMVPSRSNRRNVSIFWTRKIGRPVCVFMYTSSSPTENFFMCCARATFFALFLISPSFSFSLSF
mmetsp:Transcript_14469/g.29148  ORF Transcript_14469/g.29148 Transcript_14469/m.29148 type:complete len:250 (-) Transcript_14469:1247-1996(-)